MINPHQATARSKDFLDLIGCNQKCNFRNNSELLKCAQNVEPFEISYQTEFFSYSLFDENYITMKHNIFPFPLVLNGKDFANSIEDSFNKKKFKRCKMMIGFAEDGASSLLHLNDYFGFDKEILTENSKINSTEFESYLNELYSYYPSYPSRAPNNFTQKILNEYLNNKDYFETLISIVNDQSFACPSFKLAEIYSRISTLTDVFVYKYSHRISSSIFPSNFGVTHGEELPMLFGEPLSVKIQPLSSINFWSSTQNEYSDIEKKFSQKLIRYLANFIYFDTPNDFDLNYNNANLIDIQEELEYWPLFKKDISLFVYSENKDKWIDNGNYLVLKAGKIKHGKGYSSHKCEFWGLDEKF